MKILTLKPMRASFAVRSLLLTALLLGIAGGSAQAQNNGTAVGSPTFVAAPTGFGQQISLTGNAAQYLSFPEPGPLDFSAAGSYFVSVRVQTTSTSGLQVIVANRNQSAGQRTWFIDVNAGQAGAYVSGTSTIAPASGVGMVNDGSPHTIGLLVAPAGSNCVLFVDGAVVATVAATSNLDPNQTGIPTLGNFNGSFAFVGQVDEVAIYNVAKHTAAYTAPAAPTPSTDAGLVGLYHLDGNASDSTGAAAATAYTLTGPASGISGQASGTFTATASGSLASNVTVTPSVSGVSGTFSPSTLTLTPAQTSGTFIFTPGSAGSGIISTTNSGGLTNPSAKTYTVIALAGQFVACVDSLSYGANASSGQGTAVAGSGTAYPDVAATNLGPAWEGYNAGISGQQLANAQPLIQSQVISHFDPAVATHVVAVVGLTNDIGSTTLTAQQLFQILVTYHQSLHSFSTQASRVVTVATTITPANFASTVAAGTYSRQGSAAFDPIALQVNALIRAHWREFADALSDPAADVRLSDETNTTYYASDGTHRTDAGYAVFAGYEQAAILQAAASSVAAQSATTSTSTLVITITKNSSSQPVLTWTADPLAKSYTVFRSIGGVPPFTVLASGLTALTFTDTAEPSGNVHYAVVSVH